MMLKGLGALANSSLGVLIFIIINDDSLPWALALLLLIFYRVDLISENETELLI
jgi:hypothetical protein